MTADSHAEYYAGYALDEWDKIRGKTLFRFGGSSTDPTAILTSLNNFPCIFSMNEYHAAGVSFCDFLAGQVIYCSIACLDRSNISARIRHDGANYLLEIYNFTTQANVIESVVIPQPGLNFRDQFGIYSDADGVRAYAVIDQVEYETGFYDHTPYLTSPDEVGFVIGGHFGATPDDDAEIRVISDRTEYSYSKFSDMVRDLYCNYILST
jgi:hypothetical protein